MMHLLLPSLLLATFQAAAGHDDLLANFEPSAIERAQQRAGAVTVRVSSTDRATKKVVQAQAFVHAPATIVWEVLTDYPAYPRTFKRILRSEVHRGRSGHQRHYTLLKYPWPYSNRWVVNEVHDDREHLTITWHRVDGTIRELEGVWQLRDHGKDTTLRYGVRIDPGLPFVPRWVVDWGTRIVTPDILRAVATAAQAKSANR